MAPFWHHFTEIRSLKTFPRKTKTPANALFTGVLAERVGFEPTVEY